MAAPPAGDPVAAFLAEACVPRNASHAAGRIEEAEGIRLAHPAVATADIHTAAVLGDHETVVRLLVANPALATATSGSHGWDALTHLCFSNYLKLDPDRTDGFVRAATALLDGGASANTGFREDVGTDREMFESVLYGACGVAHHPEMTRLLLERGADPNDDEVVYHAPESYDNEAMRFLVESARLTPDSLATLLLRKLDWHDSDAVRWLLERGADPRRATRWTPSMLHHALRRENDLEIIQLLLDHSADPTAEVDGVSAIAAAARAGRGDVLDALARRGVPLRVKGGDALAAACARGHGSAVRTMVATMPDAVAAVKAHAGALLARFASIGNTIGIGHLLDIGLDVDARWPEGNDSLDIAPDSTALLVAAWRARHGTLRALLARRAAVDAVDGRGRNALALAVKACVDSYWTARREPDSVRALLDAGASPAGIALPTGYAPIDALIAARRS